MHHLKLLVFIYFIKVSRIKEENRKGKASESKDKMFFIFIDEELSDLNKKLFHPITYSSFFLYDVITVQ